MYNKFMKKGNNFFFSKFLYVEFEINEYYLVESLIHVDGILLMRKVCYIVEIRIVCPIKTCSQLSTNSQCSGKRKISNYYS